MRYLMAVAAILCASPAWADEVTVDSAWARATVPGQDTGAVFLNIISQRDARIIAVASPVADSAEIHSMAHDNGMMKMREVPSLPLPAGQKVILGSGGYHLMLLGLKRPLATGESIPLTFTVQFSDKRKETIRVAAIVKSLTTFNDSH